MLMTLIPQKNASLSGNLDTVGVLALLLPDELPGWVSAAGDYPVSHAVLL